MYEEAVADDWSVKAARWLAKPDSYFVWGPLLTLIVTIIFLCNCWRDVKRLFFNNMPKTRAHHTAAVIWLHGTGDAGAGFLRRRASASCATSSGCCRTRRARR